MTDSPQSAPGGPGPDDEPRPAGSAGERAGHTPPAASTPPAESAADQGAANRASDPGSAGAAPAAEPVPPTTPPPGAPPSGYGTPPPDYQGTGYQGTPPPGYRSTPPGYQETPPPGYQGTPPPGYQGGPPPGYQEAPPTGYYGAPGPGYQSPPYGPAAATPPTDTELNVGRALGFAWDRFRANPIPWISVTLLGFAAYLVVTVVVNVTRMNDLISVGLTALVAAVVLWLLQAAMLRGALYETDGTPPDFGAFFRFVNAGNVLITALIVGIASWVGAALCIVPAFAVGYLAMFSLHYVIDQDMDPISAIRSSVRLVISNVVPTLLLALTVAGLTLVGALLCGVGLLVAGPLTAIMVTYGYRVLSANAAA